MKIRSQSHFRSDFLNQRSTLNLTRHEGTKTQSHEVIFYKTKMLKIGKYFQPFERIELIEPFEQPLNH